MNLCAGRNGDAGIDNGLVGTEWEGEWDEWGKWQQHTCTIKCKMNGWENFGCVVRESPGWLSLMTWRDRMGGEEGGLGGRGYMYNYS